MTGFIVSSAINTKHGVFDSKLRLDQTIRTMQSIRERVTDVEIILADASGECKLTEEQLKSLGDEADYIVDLHGDSEVQAIYQNVNNWDIVKSYTEMLILIKTLGFIQHNKLNEHWDRYFKLSGRYELNDNFNLDNFSFDSWTFAKRKSSQFAPFVTGNVTEQFMSRLICFPKDISSVLRTYQEMLKHFVERANAGGYIDVEHLFFDHLKDATNLCELNIVGVQGKLGPNAVLVSD